ncbi:hypothetical protein [Synechococcus sp. MIT S1220]|uniref:hypothetical protein n=1 Tax=Synechococcus sp. MIT S1220 TaxID=3082549 RepID=UPI0039B05BA5
MELQSVVIRGKQLFWDLGWIFDAGGCDEASELLSRTVDMSERMNAKLRALSADKNVRMTKLVRMAVADLIARLEED